MSSLTEPGPVVLEKILKYRKCPLGKGRGPSNKFEFPPPNNTLCQVWLKLVHRFWRRSGKCEKAVVRFMINAKIAEIKSFKTYRLFIALSLIDISYLQDSSSFKFYIPVLT